MTKLRCNMTMSLDGYLAGPNQSADNPIGQGGLRLHDWIFPTKTFPRCMATGVAATLESTTTCCARRLTTSRRRAG